MPVVTRQQSVKSLVKNEPMDASWPRFYLEKLKDELMKFTGTEITDDDLLIVTPTWKSFWNKHSIAMRNPPDTVNTGKNDLPFGDIYTNPHEFIKCQEFGRALSPKCFDKYMEILIFPVEQLDTVINTWADINR